MSAKPNTSNPASKPSIPNAPKQSSGDMPQNQNHLNEEWDEARYTAALNTVSDMEEKITTLRLIAPSLIRTLANIPNPRSMNNTGLPSPPSSPPLQGVNEPAYPSGSPQAVYQRFEGLANRAETLIKEMREKWRSEDFKKLLDRCDRRADAQELEAGWELVVGRTRWMDTGDFDLDLIGADQKLDQ